MEKTMNKKLDLRSEAGFTLMELIVVIAIIAILIAILLPRFSGMTDKANSVSAASDARAGFTALASYTTSRANNRDDQTLIEDTAKNKIAQSLGYDDAAALPASITLGTMTSTRGNASIDISILKGGLTYIFTLDTSRGNIAKVACTGDNERCDALVGEGVVTETKTVTP